MARYRIKIAADDFDQVQRLVFSDLPKEAAAFLLAGVMRSGDDTDILVRRVVPIPAEHFEVQQEYHLEVASKATNGLAALCEANRMGAIVCHSHPEKIPYSASDDHGERRIFDTLRNFIPAAAPTASLLLYPGGADARVWLAGAKRPVAVNEIVIIGRNIRKIELNGNLESRPMETPTGLYDRQALAFGSAGQRQIMGTRVAIIGLGGTGSACAEQLARIGVPDFVLIDPDRLERSNLTRIYGAFPHDLRRRFFKKTPAPYKVDIASRHLKRINPAVTVMAVRAHTAETEAAELLRDRDVIFLCTDDHWGRVVVNQVSYQYLIPAINMGVRIDAPDGGTIVGAIGVVDVLRPGLPCLWCKQFLRAERIAAESMPEGDRSRRQEEGYVENLDSPSPSVISLTTTVSAFAITAFLQLVTDFMQERGDIARLNYDILNATVSRGRSPSPEGCICRKNKGFGDLKALATVNKVSRKGLR